MNYLDDRKKLAVELLAEGIKTKTEIASHIGISRQTLYDWMSQQEVKAELDRRLHERKVLVEKVIDSKLDFVVDELYKLAADGSNKRVQAQVLQYLADRSLGKPSSKLDITANAGNNDKINSKLLEAEFEEWEESEG